ncbi:MAG: tetratricopeptide repeat protein [Bacteroidia bacterium]|nr:tetratricopeptide repeat protein [Bacteroidia bacterium]MCO5254857.1 tetratricopeptide repeat protein [Bacteroidota bacterium]MCZ2128934.1 tetratricopeptide repeat protein [Bacteroidia bacterium]
MKKFRFLLFLCFLSPFTAASQTENYYIDKGLDYEESGNYALAIVYYDSAIMLNDINAIAYYNRGVCQFALKNTGAALVDYNKALNLDSTLADAYYNRGLTHNIINNPVLALADMETYTKLQPDDTLGYLALSDLLFQQGEYSRAIATNQRAINAGLTRKAIALKNQGVCYFKLGTNSMAEYILSQAIIESPSYDEAYKERARVRLSMELYQDAFNDIYTYMQNHPEEYDGLTIRSVCNFNLKKYDEAIKDYDILIKIEPDNGDWYFEKGNCLLKLQRDMEAEQAYTTALNSSKNTGWILVMRGVARFNQNKKEEACFDWQQARLLGEEEGILLYSKYCQEK